MEIVFTHYYKDNKDWVKTSYKPEDFNEVEWVGANEEDGAIFSCKLYEKNHIIKGYYEKK